jgi:hypothetical protein
LLSYSVFSGGLFVPILAGLVGRPLRAPAALAAALGGGSLALAGKLLGRDALIAAGFGLALAVWLADSLLAPAGRRRPPFISGSRPPPRPAPGPGGPRRPA